MLPVGGANAPHVLAHLGTRPVPASAGHILNANALPAPVPTTQCVAQLGYACYSPNQYRTAYDLNGLYARGITGAGRTVIIVDPYGSPTLQHDFDVFNAQWGLPAATLDIRYPVGPVPAYNPNDPNFPGWGSETTLDVGMVHAVAPGAHIIVAVTPVPETEGVQGFPEIMAAIKKLVRQDAGDVISMSFGATENTFPGFDQGNFDSLLDLRYAFKDARARNVALVAAAGDTGSAAIASDGQSLLPVPAVIWPGSDPLVTSAGGTQLSLDDAGNRLSPDVVWNDKWGATGGGESSVFSRPWYQNRLSSVVGDHRAIPDLDFSSAVNGGVWLYTSFPGFSAGWHIFGGTSEAAPALSGLTALADQAAGHRIGDLDGALYGLAARDGYGARSGLVDVTSGNNVLTASIPGYSAGSGFDLASGLGTFDGRELVDALAHVRS